MISNRVVSGSCHSLRGLCGLKSSMVLTLVMVTSSQPARAVWIEMVMAIQSIRTEWVTACEG